MHSSMKKGMVTTNMTPTTGTSIGARTIVTLITTTPERDSEEAAPMTAMTTLWKEPSPLLQTPTNAKPPKARGFRDQNAGPDPGWLVAHGGSKKKLDFIKILPAEVFLNTNINSILHGALNKLQSIEIFPSRNELVGYYQSGRLIRT
jgi:hypothetical protein